MDKEAIEDNIRLMRALMKQLSPADTLTRQAKEMALEVRRLEALLKSGDLANDGGLSTSNKHYELWITYSRGK